MKDAFGLLLAGLLLASATQISEAGAAAGECPFAGQKEMLVARLYLGQSEDGAAISGAAWRTFLAGTVTPRFPQGFTVYDAYGQWMSLQTHVIGREASRVIEIATPDTPAARTRIGEIARFYRQEFHQQSVGIVTAMACGAF